MQAKQFPQNASTKSAHSLYNLNPNLSKPEYYSDRNIFLEHNCRELYLNLPDLSGRPVIFPENYATLKKQRSADFGGWPQVTPSTEPRVTFQKIGSYNEEHLGFNPYTSFGVQQIQESQTLLVNKFTSEPSELLAQFRKPDQGKADNPQSVNFSLMQNLGVPLPAQQNANVDTKPRVARLSHTPARSSSNLDKKYRIFDDNVESLKKELAATRQERDQLLNQLESTKTMDTASQEYLKVALQENERLRNELKRISETSKDGDVLKSSLNSMQQLNQDLQKRLQTLTASFEQNMVNLKNECMAKDQKIGELQKNCDGLQAKLNQQTSVFEKLEENYHDLILKSKQKPISTRELIPSLNNLDIYKELELADLKDLLAKLDGRIKELEKGKQLGEQASNFSKYMPQTQFPKLPEPIVSTVVNSSNYQRGNQNQSCSNNRNEYIPQQAVQADEYESRVYPGQEEAMKLTSNGRSIGQVNDIGARIQNNGGPTKLADYLQRMTMGDSKAPNSNFISLAPNDRDPISVRPIDTYNYTRYPDENRFQAKLDTNNWEYNQQVENKNPYKIQSNQISPIQSKIRGDEPREGPRREQRLSVMSEKIPNTRTRFEPQYPNVSNIQRVQQNAHTSFDGFNDVSMRQYNGGGDLTLLLKDPLNLTDNESVRTEYCLIKDMKINPYTETRDLTALQAEKFPVRISQLSMTEEKFGE